MYKLIENICVKIFSVYFLFNLSNSVLAQTSTYIEWSKTFGGIADDRFSNIIQTKDKAAFYLVGNSASTADSTQPNKGGYDIWLNKIDLEGQLIWQKTFGGSQNENVNALVETEDGSLILVGQSNSNDGDISAEFADDFTTDALILKVDRAGNILWKKTLGGTQDDQFWDITSNDNNDFLIVGTSYSTYEPLLSNYGSRDLWALLIDAAGNIKWSRNYGGTNGDEGRSVLFDTDNQVFIIAGLSASDDLDVNNSFGRKDFWLLKINQDGDILGEKNYGGSSSEVALNLILTEQKDIILIGETDSSDGQINSYQGNGDPLVMSINADFSLNWSRTLGSPNFETGYAIQQTYDGDLLAISTSYAPFGDNVYNDLLLHKLDYETGSVIWEKRVAGSEDDFGLNAITLADNSYLIAGYTDSKDGDIAGGGKAVLHGAHEGWLLKIKEMALGSNEIIDFEKNDLIPNIYIKDNNLLTSFPQKSNKLSSFESINIYGLSGQLLQTQKLAPNNSNKLQLPLNDNIQGTKAIFLVEIIGKVQGKRVKSSQKVINLN